MIEVPVDVWSAAHKETCRIVCGFQVPIRRDIFRPIYFGMFIANLSSALGRMPEDFGGYVSAAPHNPHMYRIRNATIVPMGQDTNQGAT